MKLHTLKPASGSVHKEGKRVGRGEGSGRGGTAARGHKGAGSRSGTSTKRGFEGGQMPLYRRVPKFGFKNPNRTEYAPINLDVLQTLAENKGVKDITIEVLVQNGLVGKHDLVKILARGEVKSALNITANKCSDAAKKAIEAVGGTVTTL